MKEVPAVVSSSSFAPTRSSSSEFGSEETETKVKSVSPGIVYLGEGTSKELVTLAKEQDVDVLAVFDVRVSELRNGTKKNDTGLRIVNVRTGKDAIKTNPVNNIKVYLARQELKEGQDDPVDLMIDQLFKYADENYKVNDLPELTPEQAKSLVGKLISSKPENPLRALAEIRYYHIKQLLTDEELVLAYQKMIGDDEGTKLATGTDEVKKDTIRRYTPGDRGKSKQKTGPIFR